MNKNSIFRPSLKSHKGITSLKSIIKYTKDEKYEFISKYSMKLFSFFNSCKYGLIKWIVENIFSSISIFSQFHAEKKYNFF